MAHGPYYNLTISIQYYVIKFVNDMRHLGGFLRFLPPIKLTAIL